MSRWRRLCPDARKLYANADFSLDELERIAPSNPVVLQSVYNHSYLNSAALHAAEVDNQTPDPPGGKIEKDSAGKITGRIQGAGGVAFVAAKIPLKDEETWFANTRNYVAYLNSLGITAWSDAGAGEGDLFEIIASPTVDSLGRVWSCEAAPRA
jgi:predicted amidohydrolase YtcJ